MKYNVCIMLNNSKILFYERPSNNTDTFINYFNQMTAQIFQVKRHDCGGRCDCPACNNYCNVILRDGGCASCSNVCHCSCGLVHSADRIPWYPGEKNIPHSLKCKRCKKKKKCFPASSSINLKSGKSITMSELQVGDLVQIGR